MYMQLTFLGDRWGTRLTDYHYNAASLGARQLSHSLVQVAHSFPCRNDRLISSTWVAMQSSGREGKMG